MANDKRNMVTGLAPPSLSLGQIIKFTVAGSHNHCFSPLQAGDCRLVEYSRLATNLPKHYPLNVFHFPFSILRLSFVIACPARFRQWLMTNVKWKMENGRWKYLKIFA